MKPLGLGVLGLGEGRSIIWIVRGTAGAGQADYSELRYAWKTAEQAQIEGFSSEESYYFRFAGRTHHAGEYQNYIDDFARSLAAGEMPRRIYAKGWARWRCCRPCRKQ